MTKKLQILSMALIAGLFSLNAQVAEVGPLSEAPASNNSDALFDLLYAYDIGSNGSIGVNGNAGVAYYAAEDVYWITEWQTDVIHVVDAAGDFVESFTVPGLSGTRSITTDGNVFYVGTAGLEIFEVDPVLRFINNSIPITTGSDAEARMVTYDETLDGGNGGFWIGDFSSDIASVDMSGNELSVIPLATHGTVIYGGAVDNVSPGGPFLWIHDQSGSAPNRDFITQLELPSGNPTGVVYDFTTDGMANGATEVLAGGLFISPDVDPQYVTMVGLCQCSPSNILFGLELVEVLGNDDNELASLTIYPNPANSDTVTIDTGIAGDMEVAVFDVLGKRIINTSISNKQLDISVLNAGMYVVQVTQNEATATKKLVVK